MLESTVQRESKWIPSYPIPNTHTVNEGSRDGKWNYDVSSTVVVGERIPAYVIGGNWRVAVLKNARIAFTASMASADVANDSVNVFFATDAMASS